MLIAFGVGEVLWSLFWFYLFAIWFLLVITIFSDIVMNGEMSGMTKALWTFTIIFVPYLGAFAYLIVNGQSMSGRHDRSFRSHFG